MIAPPARDPMAFDKLLSTSWTLFRRNWTVALPPVIAAAIAIVVIGILAGVVIAVAVTTGAKHQPVASLYVVFGLLYVLLIVGLVALNVWAYTAMFGMADALWERGTATLADGNAAFRSRGGAVFVAGIGLVGVSIVAVILALPTLFISLLALLIFPMYVLPSVVSGGRGGFEAIGESFRLVIRFFGASAIACVVLYGIAYGISFIGAIPIVPLEMSILPTGSDTMPHMPPLSLLTFGLIGYAVAIVLQLAYGGFYAVAIVGMYRTLLAQPPTQLSAPAPPPPSAIVAG